MLQALPVKQAIAYAVSLMASFTPLSALSAPFSSEQCAVIIASRPTLTEAHAWAISSPYKVDVIYQSSNGYFAVSAGIISKNNWRGQVEQFKAAGIVPPDAYCSARGIVSVAAANPAEAEGKIHAEQESSALAAANSARIEAERNAASAASAAAAAEDRARRAEAAAAQIIAERERDAAAEEAAQAAVEAGESANASASTGTGFRISDRIVVTNNHVVQNCAKISADGAPATLVESSATFDLAILSVESSPPPTSWLPLSSDSPRLNSDVIAAGYPLYGLLGGMNVTRGTISRLRGLGGDDTNMQISAPIQNGNSGGPVADRFGRVVGVVVSKINNDALKEVAGLTAENVNFAIRGDVLKLMLDRYGVSYESREAGTVPSPEELADQVTAATLLIECQ